VAIIHGLEVKVTQFLVANVSEQELGEERPGKSKQAILTPFPDSPCSFYLRFLLALLKK
jgi:hypothetical protein